ncbi:MAG: hypothetical protein QT11_C0001G1020 [archaeon GW2011_AR20]|nr:MAG: hypothetical protein QT11_C0001G1020 [archaeon GW2011_AR20]AQS33423.1 hypothetical protein [uncultured archaeon]AQS33513.1 hypothetical protein [uncultured archaeon]MBS3161010.1 AbrB/MazE/SpoVT family DNA-binding domain-containing protein [Candidatus Woesearchaeota archaeon]
MIIGYGGIKIKRKVVLHGDSTLTISLPARWAKKFNIKKGDELNVEENEREIRITNDKEITLDKKQFSVGNLRRLGISYITSLYRSGYDEIHLDYNNNDYIETIHDVLSNEITGFEIVKQGNNYCVIKDLTGSKDEFNTALRRIWLLTLDLAGETLSSIKKNNVNNLKNIYFMDNSINKFSNYCLRLLNKKVYVNYSKTPLYYYLIKSLEELADKYKDLYKFYLNNKVKINDKSLETYDKINSHLNEYYNLFYSYDKEKMENLFNEARSTYEKTLNLNSNISIYLSSICNDIKDLLSVLVELNI